MGLDAEFQEWFDNVADDFRPKILDALIAPLHKVHLYNWLDQSTMWLQYYSTRILLKECMLLITRKISAFTMLQLNPYEQKQKIEIRDLARDIARSIPWVLGQIDSVGIPQHVPRISVQGVRAYTLLWPLRVAALAEHTTWKFRAFSIATLLFIGHEIGLGKALSIARSAGEAVSYSLLGMCSLPIYC